MEFETTAIDTIFKAQKTIRIYSVVVWNHTQDTFNNKDYNELEFTPLEFETICFGNCKLKCYLLEFTPLEFETIWQELCKTDNKEN